MSCNRTSGPLSGLMPTCRLTTDHPFPVRLLTRVPKRAAPIAGVPRVKPQWRDRHLKILIVGESGLGALESLLCMQAFLAVDCTSSVYACLCAVVPSNGSSPGRVY